MYVATVPNRNSPPAILLRESFRLAGKVKTRTVANISHLPSHQIEALRLALSGSLPAVGLSFPDSFLISRALPHGHVCAVLCSLRSLQRHTVAAEVSAGKPGAPKPVAAKANKIRHGFGLSGVVLGGGRGMIAGARLRQDVSASRGIQWISALRANQFQKLAKDGQVQMSL